jgi:hypothetical protein
MSAFGYNQKIWLKKDRRQGNGGLYIGQAEAG